MKRKLPSSEVVADLWQSGLTQVQIGKQYGASGAAVSECISKYYNLPVKSRMKYGLDLLLKYIKKNPNATYIDMAKAVGVHQSTIGNYLDILESEGKIKRVKFIVVD